MPEKTKIKARDVVNDIRAGMTDPELMEKYGLSAKGLQSLFRKLLEVKAIASSELKRRRADYHDTTIIQQINGGDMVKDIRSGMPDSELMHKYGLSPEGLEWVFKTLTDSKAISVGELYGASLSQQHTVAVENSRELPRHYLAITVSVYESKRPEIMGTFTDLTEKGIAILGIKAVVGERKSFVIPRENFVGDEPIVFEAECRWARKEQGSEEWHSGFEITSISRKCLNDLISLIQSASLFD